MKHFFINFLLSIFFILPNWALKVLTLRKEITHKNEVFDYQSMIYISLISWFIAKFGLALDMADFSNDMRLKMSNFRMKINNSHLPKSTINKEDHIIDKNKIPKFGIHILSGLKIKKKNAIISAKGNLVNCSARCCAKYLKNGFKGCIR